MELTPITKQKKGQIPSLILAIVSIFVAGIMIFVFSHLFGQIFDELGDRFVEDPSLNNTVANQTLANVQRIQNSSMWDFFFLAIAFAYFLSLMILAFSTRISPVFYVIFAVVSLIGLFVGVALANMWEELANQSVFANTLTRFPIMNTILDNFFPLFIVVMTIAMLIMLFGKSGGGDVR